jgi:hypothetical protein
MVSWSAAGGTTSASADCRMKLTERTDLMTTHQPPDPTATDFAHTGHFDTDPDCRWCNAIDAEELTFDAGLSEQEIRARAIDAAVRLTADRDFYRDAEDARILDAAHATTALAEHFAAYIRDGSRPGDGGEDDRDRRR